MESPGPKKPKSGAQKRREKMERSERARADLVAQAEDLGMTIEGQADELAMIAEFAAVGRPSLEDPGTDLAYTRKIQLTMLAQRTRVLRPSPELRELWRDLDKMCATIGMTHERAVLEAKVRQLEKQLTAAKERAGSVTLESGAAIDVPATARGQRRGPRSVPDEPPLDS